jgi:tripartite-type tricarboxylate transporter receptor subunit TctC
MTLARRQFLGLAGTGMALAVPPMRAFAQAYPNRPVRVLVPFVPGGTTDVLARLVAQRLYASLGQQFYIENHGGAGGNIGMGMAATSPADGYTILIISNSFFLNPSLYAKVPYDPAKDFAAVSLLATSPYLLSIHPSIPAQNLKEFVTLVKANPGKYSYASSGRGTPGHLSAELFRLPLGLDLVHVPFNGGGPAIQATLAGHVPVSFNALPTGSPHVKDGKLRPLAVMSAKRNAALPDVPTLAEAGFPGGEVDIMIGVVARTGTPQPIIDLIHREVVKITAQPDYLSRLAALGLEPVGNSPQEFDAILRAELPKWAKVIAEIKMQKVD